MDIRQVDLNLLPVLDALLRHASVTQAAHELNMSQSAMSSALGRLRGLLGDELFVRSGRGLVATPRAQALAQPLADMLDQIRDRVLQSPHFEAGSSRREFRLLLSDIGAYVMLPRIVRALREQAPSVRLALRTLVASEMADDLAQGRADLAIGTFPQLPQTVFQRRLFDRLWIGAVRPGHPWAGKRLTLQEFAQLPQLVVRMASGIQDRIDAALAQEGLTRSDVLELPSYLMVPPLLAAGDFVTVLPQQLFDDFAQSAEYGMVTLPFELPASTIRMHWHRRFHEDGANIWLRNAVSQVLSAASDKQALT